MNSRRLHYLTSNVITNGWKLGALCIKNVLLSFVSFQITGLYNKARLILKKHSYIICNKNNKVCNFRHFDLFNHWRKWSKFALCKYYTYISRNHVCLFRNIKFSKNENIVWDKRLKVWNFSHFRSISQWRPVSGLDHFIVHR